MLKMCAIQMFFVAVVIWTVGRTGTFPGIRSGNSVEFKNYQ